MDTIRITLVIYSLGCGGAERVLTTLANYWSRQNFQISLITLSNEASPFYQLSDRVHLHQLALASTSRNLLEAIASNFSRMINLRATILGTNPDVVISFMSSTNVLTIASMLGTKIPIIVSEHHDPQSSSLNRYWGFLRNMLYPYANRITLLTKNAVSFFPKRIQKKIAIIPNPTFIEAPKLDTLDISDRPLAIAMGRLVEQKGFDLLLYAFAKIADFHPSWKLLILGEGPLRQDLEALILKLKLSERVLMPGRVTNPHDYLRNADLFVMASRHEGFPMALCEALACGLPAISTDCPSGPAEIIRQDIDGLLVPNEDIAALAEAIDCLMSQETLRFRMRKHAPDILIRYSVESVMGDWEKLLRSVISGNQEYQKV